MKNKSNTILSSIEIGDKVTCKVPSPPYGGNDTITRNAFMPGDIGTVGAIKVPYVTHIKGNSKEFICVDYEKNGQVWRTGLDYKNIIKA